MKRMTNRAALVAVTVFMTVGAAYAVPLVSDVVMTQQTGTRIVKITYNLADEAAIVTLGIETNGVAIPDAAVTRLTGDVCKTVEIGSRSITWNAGADWPENLTSVAKAKVTAWSVDAPPLYCAVDVTQGTSAQTYPVYYYVSAEGVPGGVTNYAYKTNLILMRRIDSTGGEGFWMGSPSNETGRNVDREAQVRTWLTKGYYVGVYQVTQSQWQQVMGDVRSWPSFWNNNEYRLTRPVEQVSYNDIRGSSAGAGWPADDNVDQNTFIWRLRSKAGLAGFDLPTEAQWEYACRAGTTGALNDSTMNLTNVNSDARLDLLGRYQYNGGKINGTTDPAQGCTTENATATVGSYAPNEWGLYDMHANVWEWCLDRFADARSGGYDPKGADSGSRRVVRGGSWDSPASDCRSAYRIILDPSSRFSVIGFRLVRTLP